MEGVKEGRGICMPSPGKNPAGAHVSMVFCFVARNNAPSVYLRLLINNSIMYNCTYLYYV